MKSRAATWIAFSNIFGEKLATTPRRLVRPSISGTACLNSNLVSVRSLRVSKSHFASYPSLNQSENNKARDAKEKRKVGRAGSSPASTSLRRVAVEAQRSSHELIKGTGKRAYIHPEAPTKDVAAYCAAEKYDLHIAQRVLEKDGYSADPLNNGLFPQVLHVQTPNYIARDHETGVEQPQGLGDIFVFPSGCVVAWNVPGRIINSVVHRVLPNAAENGHLGRLETEDLQYVEDPSRETSKIVGDTILLGCKVQRDTDEGLADLDAVKSQEVDVILAKIAFSSALARSAKLAVLEESLDRYFESTRSIPSTLSSGRKLRLTRAFLLRKTGELLNIRAQLNLYSELTDSLPDLFWDSPFELGLESYYEEVGRALDVNIRIKTLNERMDYAREIAEVLRERLSEKHSTGLEWLIIGLISIEVVFGMLHLWHERSERMNPDSTKALLTEWLEKELRNRKVTHDQQAT